MMDSSLDGYRVLVAPGLHNSGSGHWQTRWQHLFPRFERVVQQRWDRPHLATWSGQLRSVLQQSSEPVLVVAHSFGCLATVHASVHVSHLAGALLVAPADPVKFGVADRLLELKLPCPSIVVGSLDDPWMDAWRAAAWAKAWGSEFVCAGALGHINADSHLGDWPFGLALLDRLSSMAAGAHKVVAQ